VLSGSRRHSQTIDAVRFLAAFCVVLHHALGRPHKLEKLGEHLFGPGSQWLADLLASVWFGPAAVIVFFVVSGYCVHGPHVDDDTACTSRRFSFGAMSDC
jgi:peptidoglycan/LPS O-acetylase OafA/YrhL